MKCETSVSLLFPDIKKNHLKNKLTFITVVNETFQKRKYLTAEEYIQYNEKNDCIFSNDEHLKQE